MKAWLHRVTGPVRGAMVCDLPAEFGERMTLETVRGVFTDESDRGVEIRNAMVQLLWMHRAQAIEEGRDAARAGEGKRAVFHFGEVNFCDNVLADVQELMRSRGKKDWKPDEQVRAWFRQEVVG